MAKPSTSTQEGGANYPELTNTLIFLWVEFWAEAIGVTLTDSDLPRPVYQNGFNWPIVLPSQVGNQAIFELIKRFSPTYSYWDDLGQLKVEEPYLAVVDSSPVVLIRPNIEPDIRLSYNDAVAKQIPFISLCQYMAFVAFLGWLFKNRLTTAENLKLSKHLDVAGWTRTASLAPDGSVAYGHWSGADGGFRVYWSYRGDASPRGGIRQAVS